MKYLSLFSGIGGFELGIQQAYEELLDNKSTHIGKKSKQKDSKSRRKWNPNESRIQLCDRNNPPLCVGYSEIDKYAIQIYQKQFPKHKNYGDITKITASKIPDHDLLVGGFPCQSFSIAGKRGGFKDTRGTLFFDIARILKVKRPKNFVLENVKGLLSHDKGNTFATIISTIDELGYDCQWSVLNSKNFGVPQNRERVFIVGHLRGEPRPKVFPIGESDSRNIESKQDDSKISRTISARFRKGVGNTESRIIDVLVNASQGQRIRNIKGLASTLQGLAGGQGGKTGLYAVLTPDRPKKRQEGRRFKEDGEPSFALTGQDIHGISDGTKIRRLTPTECERLQGFPDRFTEIGTDTNGNEVMISDTQRYKVLGNAVSCPVIEAIVKKMLL